MAASQIKVNNITETLKQLSDVQKFTGSHISTGMPVYIAIM